jgi:hypothetical protein
VAAAPVTCTSIQLLAPAGPSKAATGAGPELRKFSAELKHQFDAVNAQVEHGLVTVKRACVYMEAVLRACEHTADPRKVGESALQNKFSDDPAGPDEVANFQQAASMLQEVLLHACVSADSFRKAAQAEAVTPLYAFYKNAQSRRREVAKEHAKMLATWASTEAALFKERNECTKAYHELRAAIEAKEKEDLTETKEKYPKLLYEHIYIVRISNCVVSRASAMC